MTMRNLLLTGTQAIHLKNKKGAKHKTIVNILGKIYRDGIQKKAVNVGGSNSHRVPTLGVENNKFLAKR